MKHLAVRSLGWGRGGRRGTEGSQHTGDGLTVELGADGGEGGAEAMMAGARRKKRRVVSRLCALK
jgi:hypothetical protein